MNLQTALKQMVDGQREILLAITELNNFQSKTEGQLSRFELKLDDLQDYTKNGFDVMNAGFDTMSDRFDRLEDQLDRLSAELGPGGYQR